MTFTNSEGIDLTALVEVVSDETITSPDSDISSSCPVASLPLAGTRYVTFRVEVSNEGHRATENLPGIGFVSGDGRQVIVPNDIPVGYRIDSLEGLYEVPAERQYSEFDMGDYGLAPECRPDDFAMRAQSAGISTLEAGGTVAWEESYLVVPPIDSEDSLVLARFGSGPSDREPVLTIAPSPLTDNLLTLEGSPPPPLVIGLWENSLSPYYEDAVVGQEIVFKNGNDERCELRHVSGYSSPVDDPVFEPAWLGPGESFTFVPSAPGEVDVYCDPGTNLDAPGSQHAFIEVFG